MKGLSSHHNCSLPIVVIGIVVIVINAFVGLIWIAGNISYIPRYGDSSEYLHLSKSLIVDQWRGILYPYLLNRSNLFAEATGLKVQHIIYLLQISLTFVSIIFMAFVLLPNTMRRRIRLFIAFIAATSVSLDPLVAHFSLSIMTDSLAASLSVIYLSFLILALKEDAAGAGIQALFIIIFICFFILMSLIRTEKIYFGLIVFSLFLVIFAFRNIHAYSHKMMKYFLPLLCVCVAIAIVSFIKSKTEIYNPDRPPPDISSFAFSRVVWPRMGVAYEYFPVNIKKIVTKAEADKFDEYAVNVYPFVTKILQEKDGKEVITSITRITLEHYPLQVFANTTYDFLKYTLPNIAFPLESVGVLPTSSDISAADWTISRMEMYQPSLTRIYLISGVISFFAILINVMQYLVVHNGGLSLQWRRPVLRRVFISNPAIVILSMAIIANSLLFTLFHGMDAHIRYALPSYTIILTGLVTLFFRYIFCRPSNQDT